MSINDPYAESAIYTNVEDEEDDIYGKRPKLTKTLHIAVAGCSHGEMDRIYETLEQIQLKRRMKFDFLLCCGDFQVLFFMLFIIKFSLM